MRPMSITVSFRDICDLLARYGVTQNMIAERCHTDISYVSKLKNDHYNPGPARVQQFVDSLSSVADEKKLPKGTRTDYLLAWQVGLGYVPRGVKPAGKAVIAMLDGMTIREQQEILSLVKRARKEFAVRAAADKKEAT